MWRIALFYIGSMAVIVTLVPWDPKELVEKGPYVAALDHSLVTRGQGPRALARISGGVPRRAVLTSCVFGFLCVLLSYWRADI